MTRVRRGRAWLTVGAAVSCAALPAPALGQLSRKIDTVYVGVGGHTCQGMGRNRFRVRDAGVDGGLLIVVAMTVDDDPDSLVDSLPLQLFLVDLQQKLVPLFNDLEERVPEPHWSSIQLVREQDHELTLELLRPPKQAGHKFMVKVKARGTAARPKYSEVFQLYFVDRGDQFCSANQEDADAPHP